MNNFSKNECIALLVANNTDQPKAHYSNDVLLHMLNAVDNDSIFTVEPTRGKFAMNRGSLCEGIIKAILGIDLSKTQKGVADIDLKGIDNIKFGLPKYAKKLEVKFATSFADASDNAPKTKYVLLVTAEGCFNIDTNNHKQGKYTRNSIFEGTRNNIISEMLGF